MSSILRGEDRSFCTGHVYSRCSSRHVIGLLCVTVKNKQTKLRRSKASLGRVSNDSVVDDEGLFGELGRTCRRHINSAIEAILLQLSFPPS
jgi:hypothetical protein